MMYEGKQTQRQGNKIQADGDCVKADSHIACRAHAVPLLCRASKSLECVFPI